MCIFRTHAAIELEKDHCIPRPMTLILAVSFNQKRKDVIINVLTSSLENTLYQD
jgi:hypothetical protein